MGTYFSPQQLSTALSAPQGTTGTATVSSTAAGGSSASNTVPYGTPSSFVNVPLNQLGPYNDSAEWGGMDPTAMVTIGQSKGNPLKGPAMLGQLQMWAEEQFHTKMPRGADQLDWLLGQIKQHYAPGGQHLLTPGTGTGPAKPPKALGSVDGGGITAGDLAGAAKTAMDVLNPVMYSEQAVAKAAGDLGKTPIQTGSPELKSGTGPHEATSTGSGLSSAGLSEPAPTTSERTRNNGNSVLKQDPATGLWWWASQKDGQWVPDRNQGKESDRQPPPAPVQAQPGGGVMPKRAAVDPRVQQIAEHLGVPLHSGEDPLVQIAQGLKTVDLVGNNQPNQVKAGDLVTTLGMLTRDQLAQFQEQLFQGGFYDSRSWTPGLFDGPTKQAVGGLVKATAYSNANAGKSADVPQNLKFANTWDVLHIEQQNMLKMYGPQGAEAALAQSASKKYTQATQSQMDQPTLNAYEARLGRAPTAAELASVTQTMDQQQAAHAETMPSNSYVVPGEGGVSAVPGVTTPTALAAQQAMTGSPTEYEGHSLANAYGLMINAMSAKPLGADPSLVTPTRPL